jgi:dCMP deaminase
MAKQSDLDLAYMKMASAMADLSHARRKKVGAIVVSSKGYGVIAEGFNGTPPGFDNGCEDEYVSVPGALIDHEYVNKDSIDRLQRAYPEMFTTDRKAGIPFLVTKDEVLHAEENAIAKLAEFGHSSFGATLYCTCAPCLRCARQIIACKITRVVYAEIYRNDLGLRLLEKAKIVVANVPLILQHDDALTQKDEGRYDLHEDQYRA